ncbi:hypothetical protein Ancab_037443 [Ancistrocladus abbreviatus]
MGKASEEHSEKCGTTGVGSWPSVIPCTLDGRPYNDCFDSPEKDCSRKVVHVSHAESSSTAVNRDAIHVLASGTLLKDAFMDDMRGSPGKSEKGKPAETTAGTQSLSQGGGSPSPGLVGGPKSRCVGKALFGSEYVVPISGPGRELQTSESGPKVVGPKKITTAKKPKKVTPIMISPIVKEKAKLVVLLHLLKPATPAVSVVFAGSVLLLVCCG